MARKPTPAQVDAQQVLANSGPGLWVLNMEFHQDGDVTLFCRTVRRRESEAEPWRATVTEMYRIDRAGGVTPV